jgi:hypothetical protein
LVHGTGLNEQSADSGIARSLTGDSSGLQSAIIVLRTSRRGDIPRASSPAFSAEQARAD